MNPPIVRPLPDDFSILNAFARLQHLPGCLWLDSSSSTSSAGRDRTTAELGRYSFLTADPISRRRAAVGDPDPWPELDRWCDALPSHRDHGLPPFQGGIAGLIGYEAGAWLEPVGLARENDLPTPALSLGLYDWTIAVDHAVGRGWLISQGLGHSNRHAAAAERADQIESLLAAPSPFESTRTTEEEPLASAPVVTSNMTGDEFRSKVADVVRRIQDGDSFQVNLAQRLLRRADRSPAELYLRLRQSNPAPFSAYFHDDDYAVLSSSPEGFLKVRDGFVETRPIKGTVSRTGNEDQDDQLARQLSASEKDRAENIMIVDLMRNDLSCVCDDESVSVHSLCQIERYQYVQHLVSVVRGRLRDDQTVVDLLRACFPGGSVTGAPKIEAMRTIADLEPHHRGPYCGSIGYLGCGGAADFNILIRTITAAHGYWQIPVGGGITARSDPQAEEAETWTKAEGMLRAIDPRLPRPS